MAAPEIGDWTSNYEADPDQTLFAMITNEPPAPATQAQFRFRRSDEPNWTYDDAFGDPWLERKLYINPPVGTYYVECRWCGGGDPSLPSWWSDTRVTGRPP
jgi:hypothetical protein